MYLHFEMNDNIVVFIYVGSPMQPSNPVLSAGDTSVTISWVNGDAGDSHITSYIIQGKQKGG